MSAAEGASIPDFAYELGPFGLDPKTLVLSRSGVPEPLGARGVAVLCALIRTPQQTVSKRAILESAWPGLVVEESNLSVQISDVRRVLAAVPGGERWVETVPRRGYRFVGPVVELRQGVAQPAPGRSNVPQSLTSFVGRTREIAELKRLIVKRRLLSLVGPGGIGKTRLASQLVAEIGPQFRDGVWFVDLAPLASGESVPNAIAQVLGIAQTASRPPLELVCEFVRSRRLIVLLDNGEHVLDAAAHCSDALLRSGADAIVIVTTREPLHVNGEHVYRLGSLSLPPADAAQELIAASEAVQLFVDRSQYHALAFTLDASAAMRVAELCVRLDGIPLALELAAARLESMSIDDICSHLDRRFQLLTEGNRTALPRQQTLHATFDWSYELLGDPERIVLRRLTVFVGSFTEDAAAVVVDGHMMLAEARVVLKSLVERSLLMNDSEHGATRYRLLETTRCYGLEQLETAAELHETRRRHAAYFCDRFETALIEWLHLPDSEWRHRYLPDTDNVRAALQWSVEAGDRAVLVALTGASGPLWTALSLYRESLQRFETAAGAVADTTSAAHEARLCLWRGILSANSAPADAKLALERAVALYRRTPHLTDLAHACTRLAYVLMISHRIEDAALLIAEARPLIAASSSVRLQGYVYGMCGHLKSLTNDPSGARVEFEHALDLFREAGNEVSVLESLGNLADVSWSLGELDAAEALLREYISMRGSPYVRRSRLGFAFANLAGVLTERVTSTAR